MCIIFLVLFQEIIIGGHGVNRLRLAQAKMLGEPSKAALKLLACLFTPEELVNGNPTGTTNSKDIHRQQTVKTLDLERMRYIEGILCHTS